MSSVKELQKNTFDALKGTLGFSNTMESPKLDKVVLSVGVGSVKEKDKFQVIQDRLARISGQKVAIRPAKKSIASFKVREGDIVGYQVTLRGERMITFLDKLIHIALPRTKDFRGIERKSIDEMGNITIGIPEHTVFPETSDEDLRDVFGFAVTIVTTADTKEGAEAFLEHIGIPFKKKA